MPNPAAAAPNTWTCSRCEVTVSFSPDVVDTGLPSTWSQEDGELYCLSCRRDMAGEAGLEGVDEDIPNQKRLQLRSHARIEFEIKRDPDPRGQPDRQGLRHLHLRRPQGAGPA